MLLDKKLISLIIFPLQDEDDGMSRDLFFYNLSSFPKTFILSFFLISYLNRIIEYGTIHLTFNIDRHTPIASPHDHSKMEPLGLFTKKNLGSHV